MPSDEDLDRAVQSVPGNKPRPKVSAPVPPRKPVVPNVAKAVDPASRAQAAKKGAVIPDAFDYDTAVHFAFVGAGQGGGKLAQSFYDVGYRRVAVFNTTENDFVGIDPAVPRLSLDIGGAAKDMDLARGALKSREEEVWELLTRAWGSKHLDCGMVCVGLGGGTGSGTALPLVNIARKYMQAHDRPARVGAVVSMPSASEGPRTAQNAIRAFTELVEAGVSPIIVIDKDKIQEEYGPPIAKLLPTSNEIVSQLLHLFNQLAATKSPIATFDQSELMQLLDGGIVVMGSADMDVSALQSPADVSKAIRERLEHSVLAETDLRTGRLAACLFVADDDVLNTYNREFFDAGFDQIDRLVGSGLEPATDKVIHHGIYAGSTPGLQCYTMISALTPPAKKLQALAKKAGLIMPRALQGGVASHLKVD